MKTEYFLVQFVIFDYKDKRYWIINFSIDNFSNFIKPRRISLQKINQVDGAKRKSVGKKLYFDS